MPRSRSAQLEWVMKQATRFLEETREELGRAARQGSDLPPRLRMVHERPNHSTPELRTLAIPVGSELEGASPEVLSGMIARHARPLRPSCLLLALEAEREDEGRTSPILIAEVRDRAGIRMYWMQPFTRGQGNGRVVWGEPLGGEWQDPGGEEMILDAAFAGDQE